MAEWSGAEWRVACLCLHGEQHGAHRAEQLMNARAQSLQTVEERRGSADCEGTAVTEATAGSVEVAVALRADILVVLCYVNLHTTKESFLSECIII